MKAIKNILMNNLFEFSSLFLTQLSSTYAQAAIWLEEGKDKQIATFDLVVRDMPKNRNYMVCGGLEELVNYLTNLRYSEEQIQILIDGNLITKKFADYLRKFRFTGDVSAMPEGTIFFPGEPIIRITAPLIEASVIETVIFGITVSNVLFMSKAARISTISKDIVLGMQRSQSFESGMKGLRSGYICGLHINAWPEFIRKYKIPQQENYLVLGQHFFIKSFTEELTAFRKMVHYFPDNGAFMVDTYDIKQGIKNAIIVAKELQKKGGNLNYIGIDSGDLGKLSFVAKKMLDKNGLHNVKIMVATNLDEYKVKKLLADKAPIDSFVIATEYATMSDSPSLEVVYKVAEIRDGKNIHYTAKLTPGKQSYPGRKQVFRKYKNNKIAYDIVGLENENYGSPLLKKVLTKGKLVKKLPSLDEIRKYFNKQLSTIPEKLLDIDKQHPYRVDISKKLEQLLDQVKKEHLK